MTNFEIYSVASSSMILGLVTLDKIPGVSHWIKRKIDQMFPDRKHLVPHLENILERTKAVKMAVCMYDTELYTEENYVKWEVDRLNYERGIELARLYAPQTIYSSLNKATDNLAYVRVNKEKIKSPACSAEERNAVWDRLRGLINECKELLHGAENELVKEIRLISNA